MDNSNSYQFRHGFSKSQLCLHKILQIIASYPSQREASSSSAIPQIIEFEEKKAPTSIDLNSELFPSPSPEEADEEEEEESENLSASSTTAAVKSDDLVHRDLAEEESSSEEECDPNAIEKGSEKSENDGGVSAEEAAVEGGKRKTDCFSLLIEAAETVSSDDKIEEEKRIAQLENDQSEADEGGEEAAVLTVEEVSPTAVVRSKRERNHVLPSRYRDSVVEPLKRRQPRSIVSTKRGKFNK